MNKKKNTVLRKKNKRPTIIDVAQQAQVAPSTVSLFLNNPAKVSAALSQRIQTVIQDLNYMPSKVAGSLSSNNSRIIAVLLPSVSTFFFSSAVQAMQQTCEAHGYSMLLAITDYDEVREKNLINALMQWSPAGLIVTGKKYAKPVRQLLKQIDVPIGQLWEVGGNDVALQVGVNHYAIGATTAQHLIEQGVKHPVFIGARMHSDWRARVRYTAAQETFAVKRKTLPLIDSDVNQPAEEVAELVFAYLNKHPKTDAILASNDNLALACLLGFERQGIAVPEQIKVTGFGGLNFAAATNPALTTIDFPKKKIGVLMVEHLIERIEGDKYEKCVIDVGFDLIVRNSSVYKPG